MRIQFSSFCIIIETKFMAWAASQSESGACECVCAFFMEERAIIIYIYIYIGKTDALSSGTNAPIDEYLYLYIDIGCETERPATMERIEDTCFSLKRINV